jgi:hypothetical protein
MTARSALLALVVAVASLATGCGNDCQSTCQRLYGDEPNCNIERPGKTKEELLRDCEDHCKEALRTPGEVGNYNPTERTPQSETVNLDNDKQAALWMDCIEETACTYLDPNPRSENDNQEGGYCAPVW